MMVNESSNNTIDNILRKYGKLNFNDRFKTYVVSELNGWIPSIDSILLWLDIQATDALGQTDTTLYTLDYHNAYLDLKQFIKNETNEKN